MIISFLVIIDEWIPALWLFNSTKWFSYENNAEKMYLIFFFWWLWHWDILWPPPRVPFVFAFYIFFFGQVDYSDTNAVGYTLLMSITNLMDNWRLYRNRKMIIRWPHNLAKSAITVWIPISDVEPSKCQSKIVKWLISWTLPAYLMVDNVR